MKSQASGQIPPQPTQPQAPPHQPTEADYQALLASVTSEPSTLNSDAMSILPRFSHTSGADLEAHRVPQHVIAFVEQNREHLQRAAQDQNGFRIALTSKNQSHDNRTQISQAPAHQGLARPPQLIPGPQMLQQQLQRQVLAQGPGKPNTLPNSQLFNSPGGPLPRPSTAQSMAGSGMPSIGAQIAGPSSSGGAQGPGAMSVPMHPVAVNGVGAVQVRRPTTEELMAAKRWVEDQKRKAFSRGKSRLLVLLLSNLIPFLPDFDGVAGYPTIPENDIQEYHRNLERLDQVLANIEKYIHVAFAALKKEDVVLRMFTMVSRFG